MKLRKRNYWGINFPSSIKRVMPAIHYERCKNFSVGIQLSDVQINNPITGRTALAHGLLAFTLNTFLVALPINLIAGIFK